MAVKLRALRQVLGLVALSLLASACASGASGTPIDGRAAKALDDAPQTREDVRRQFGEPNEIEVITDGIETWRYRYRSAAYRSGPDATLCSILDWFPFRFFMMGPSKDGPCPPRLRTEQVLTVTFAPTGQVQDVAYVRRELLEPDDDRIRGLERGPWPPDPGGPVARNDR